jgi:HK97 family phage prohead protease
MRLISVEEFRQAAREKRPHGSDGVFRVNTRIKPRALDDGSRAIRFCFSDGSVDRMSDTIDPAGWELSDFTANPVALWAHDSSAPPIGRAANVATEADRLMGDITFADAATYAFADTIYRLYLGEFLNAVSVGFLPLEYSFVENDPERGWGIDFKRQELLEISCCPIPANPNALAEARATGINLTPLVKWAEATLDAGGLATVPRDELDRLRKQAKELSMTVRRQPRRRAGDDPDEDKPEDKVQATCGRKADAECGLKDSSECAIHGKAEPDDKPDDDDESKRLRRLLRQELRHVLRADGDPDDLPMEHHDAVRMAHKCLRTSKAFLAEAVTHHSKAVDLLSGVVEALNGDNGNGDKPDEDPDDKPDEEKAAQLRRAAELRTRIRSVA